MNVHLKITGSLLISLALLHLFFPKYFKWKEELISLSVINRQMMYAHTFFITLAAFLMGILCLTSATGLSGTALGKRISLGLAIFWLARLAIQFFVIHQNFGRANHSKLRFTFCFQYAGYTLAPYLF
jgi:hypothetical protein